MFHEICITVTMRLVAFGHPLDRTFARVEERFAFFSSLTSDEVRDLADAIMLHVVLLCTLLGYRIVRTDDDGRPEERAFFRACVFSSLNIRGILPVVTGTAGNNSRAFLQE